MVVLMPVVPQLGFVEQKKENQPDQQGHEQLMRPDLAFKRFGQQMHEGRGQQGTGRQTEHVLRVTRQHTKAQRRRQPDAANASKQGSQHNCYQNHSCIRSFNKGQSPI